MELALTNLMDMPDIDTDNNHSSKVSINWNLLFAVGAFLVGILFSGGMNWGRSSGSLDNLNTQLNSIQSKVESLNANLNGRVESLGSSLNTQLNGLSKQVNDNNMDTRDRLRALEDEAKNLQLQVDEMRTSRRETH